MLEVLLQALLQRVRDLVELVELPHPLHRRMVPVHHHGQEAVAPCMETSGLRTLKIIPRNLNEIIRS